MRDARGQRDIEPASVALDRSGLMRTLALHVVLVALAVVAIVPLVWLVCACFKTQEDLFAHAFLPWHDLRRLTLGNFRTLFAREPIGHWLVNSLLVSSLQTVLVVALSSLGGFALAKYPFAGRRIVMALMLATMLLPGIVLLPSSWLLMYHLGWLNGYAAVIVPGSASAFGTFLFMQAMRSVPDELLEAGRVDGCSELRLWWDLALPVVRPMVGAYTLLAFTASWNSFLWPRVVLQDENKFTLPMGLAGMIGMAEFETQYGVLMAG